MCGIAGILAADPSRITSDRLSLMNRSLSHRGPDGNQLWISPSGQTGFAQSRLIIIDTSDAAAQPFHYLERYTVLHNGEIYNYRELRTSLEKKGYVFHTRSDTEVIPAAYDCYGEDCLRHFDGMFAIAIWDEQEQVLFAARDRMGEKPFFYSLHEGQLLFASEMKSLWAAGVKREMDNYMLYNYLTLGYTLHPAQPGRTFYTGIQKLPARSYFKYRIDDIEIKPLVYWNLENEDSKPHRSEQALFNHFNALFRQSVTLRLRSDMPLGISLSGGLDSSSVLATASQAGIDNIQSFSVVFPGFEKDESVFVAQMLEAFPGSNYQVTPEPEHFVEDLEKVCTCQEEPFQSASIVTQYQLYKLAASHGIKVLLDGQGADEILAGYHKYYHWYWQELYATDKELLKKEMEAAGNNGISTDWNWTNKIAAGFPLATSLLAMRQKNRLQRRQEGLAVDFVRTFGQSHYELPHTDQLGSVLYYNTFQNGLEELLRYADRNAMANGVEVRLPFLNHELVNFVFSLPSNYKIRNGYTKWLLRKSMEKVLPPAITWRKDKVGFEPPQQNWLQQKPAEALYHDAVHKLVSYGILDKLMLQKKIQPADAHAAENFYWRYLVAGLFV